MSSRAAGRAWRKLSPEYRGKLILELDCSAKREAMRQRGAGFAKAQLQRLVDESGAGSQQPPLLRMVARVAGVAWALLNGRRLRVTGALLPLSGASV
eukprot:4852598-Pyramimonas_sp.AAC.1